MYKTWGYILEVFLTRATGGGLLHVHPKMFLIEAMYHGSYASTWARANTIRGNNTEIALEPDYQSGLDSVALEISRVLNDT